MTGRARVPTPALRLMLGVAVAVVLGAVWAAGALAWRAPTRRERRAITRVAKRSPHAGRGRIHVSHIRVSTVGPWASATITIYFGGQPDEAIDVLHRVHGRWRRTAHSPGGSGEQCGIGMPHADQHNLGFIVC